MTGPIGPGTVFAGRYRLDDLLTESDGARFWRATDTILARSVAIHAVSSSDARAPHLLDAARVSATVTDPHLLRVLDCSDDNGVTWVVNEWGDGISLDLMLQQGTLPPSRAAWLTREVAEAIAAGHAQGIAHGRLNPEAVLVTHAGAVKLIGYVVDATLEGPRPPDPLYGEIDERESDVINLAGILYAALTGRWPGVARSAVPPAPRESRRPLRPRQVRAGVPRTLDAICERVLHKEASQHALPIETAHEIAAALADYVGDPGLSAPLDAAGMHAEATVSIHRDALTTAAGAAAAQEVSAWQPQAEATGEQTQVSSIAESADQTDETPVTDESEDTAYYREPLDDATALSPLRPPVEEVTPPPPFEEPPDRPLFATTERRVPAAAQAAAAQTAASSGRAAGQTGASLPAAPGGPPPPGAATDTDTSGFWPFTDEAEEKNEVHTGKEGRGWLRMAIVVGVLLVLVVAMAIAFNRGRQDASPTQGSGSDPGTSSTAKSAPVKIAAVTDFDPFADPPEENPDTVKNAIDGDSATSWMTSTYRGSAELGGLKPGVGLMLDLGKDTQAGSVTVEFAGKPTSFEVYAASAGVTDPPDSLDQMDKVGSKADVGAKATVQLDPAPKTRYLLVWLTKLPAVSGGFRGEIVDISVRS